MELKNGKKIKTNGETMEEITLSKAIMPGRKIDSVIIKIQDDLPDIFELNELYDSTIFFKDQAEKLAEVLYASLPVATLKELMINLTKRMYGIGEIEK